MQKENQLYNIQPADRLANVSEYYFSRKLKEVAQMNAEGKNVISLGIGSPDMPPSEETVNVLCEQASVPMCMVINLPLVFLSSARQWPIGTSVGMT